MITVVGATSASADGGATLTLPNTFRTQRGDVLLAAIHGVPPAIPDPDVLWWPLGALTYNGNFTSSLYLRVTESDEPSTYGWMWPRRLYGAEGSIVALQGCTLRNPVDLVAGRLITSLTSYHYRVVGHFDSPG